MIKRIRVVYDSAGDWCCKDNSHSPVICNSGLRDWWDIGNATELNVVISDRPHKSAYKCERNVSRFFIFDEITSKFYYYSTYRKLMRAIRGVAPNRGDTFYLGIEVVE